MILSGLKYLVDRTTQELIKILVKEKGITKEEAMNTKIYQNLDIPSSTRKS